MADKTGISWSDATWNPTTGCDRVTPGCDNCYALTLAKRLKAMKSPKYQTDGDPRTSGEGFGIASHPTALDQPIRWQRGRHVFVNSMSDLFHAGVTDEFIAQVFAVMALSPQHRFQVLTKRHARMRSLLSSAAFVVKVMDSMHLMASGEVEGVTVPRKAAEKFRADQRAALDGGDPVVVWPLPNVWVGVSVEDQKRANLRIPALLQTPAAVRFLSCEPLLGSVDLAEVMRQWSPPFGDSNEVALSSLLHWVIVGGESGAGARPMRPEWAQTLRDQCAKAGVALWFKQWGEYQPVETPEVGDTWVLGDGNVHGIGWTPESVGAVAGKWHDLPDIVMRHVGKHADGYDVLDGQQIQQWPHGHEAVGV